MQVELEIDERTRVRHTDERFNYFYDWSQEMSHNDTHLVPVVLYGDFFTYRSLKNYLHPLSTISVYLERFH